GRVHAREEVLERFVRGETEVLLLERQSELLSERSVDALCGEPERRSEAQPGLYGHDEQVDQIRKLVVDLLQPKPAAAPDEGMRKHPASGDRDKRAQHESGDAVAGGAPEPDQEQRQEQRRKRLIPQKLVR